MTKREFLDTLRMQLQGELSNAQIEGHLRYYEEYISDTIASGKTEAEVLEELGSPVFIAKTILDTTEAAQEAGDYDQGSYNDRDTYGENGTGQTSENPFAGTMHHFNIPPFVLKWIVPIVIVFIIMMILSLLGSVMMLVARFFIPILLVIFVISLFKRHGGR